jgi:hypothetical protein
LKSDVNAHMLSQVLASSYAPPVAPHSYYEPREDQAEEDTDPAPATNDELLIDIVGCTDKSTNGTFAWVGTCNKRPMYRILGAEPRYLYYADIDPTWAGWWIASKAGSDDYIEWFRQPQDAKLPIYCKAGELGSHIVATELTKQVAQKICTLNSQQEKQTIRAKLVEGFGPAFTKLEGTQRGLMSKTSPVVSIAHTLEAQQRTIQMLHSQLTVTSQARDAAETHAQTMEEAFETLQLRIQAKLPGGGGVDGLGLGGRPI